MAVESETLAVSLGCSPHIASLLAQLHLKALEQYTAVTEEVWKSISDQYVLDPASGAKALDVLTEDMLASIDEDKCLFIYNLIIATGATVIVEAGTGYGISTMYLALGVKRNVESRGGEGVVIGTEDKPEKVMAAKEHWAQAGPEVEKWIQLRVGDMRETLVNGGILDREKVVDIVILDTWPDVHLAVLQLLLPRLRRGSVVVTGNTTHASMGNSLDFLRAPEGPFRSSTILFERPLEFSVYDP